MPKKYYKSFDVTNIYLIAVLNNVSKKMQMLNFLMYFIEIESFVDIGVFCSIFFCPKCPYLLKKMYICNVETC